MLLSSPLGRASCCVAGVAHITGLHGLGMGHGRPRGNMKIGINPRRASKIYTVLPNHLVVQLATEAGGATKCS